MLPTIILYEIHSVLPTVVLSKQGDGAIGEHVVITIDTSPVAGTGDLEPQSRLKRGFHKVLVGLKRSKTRCNR
jgi:hypothetical protein